MRILFIIKRCLGPLLVLSSERCRVFSAAPGCIVLGAQRISNRHDSHHAELSDGNTGSVPFVTEKVDLFSWARCCSLLEEPDFSLGVDSWPRAQRSEHKQRTKLWPRCYLISMSLGSKSSFMFGSGRQLCDFLWRLT